MKDLNKTLGKVFNTLGNKYITDNFDSEPFEFKVNIRRGDREEDLQHYIIEVYSIPDMPNGFTYKPGIRDNMNGIHISVLKREFLDYIKYIDSSFGRSGRSLGIRFMNIQTPF